MTKLYEKATPRPWRVRQPMRDGVILDTFVTADDVNGFAYDAEILGEDEYRNDDDRDGDARKAADCALIVHAVNNIERVEAENQSLQSQLSVLREALEKAERRLRPHDEDTARDDSRDKRIAHTIVVKAISEGERS